MTNIQSSAVIAETEGPLVPKEPSSDGKAKAAWRSLNFGPRLWISAGLIISLWAGSSGALGVHNCYNAPILPNECVLPC